VDRISRISFASRRRKQGHAFHRLRHRHQLRAVLQRAVPHYRRALAKDAASTDCNGFVGEGRVLNVVPVQSKAQVHSISSYAEAVKALSESMATCFDPCLHA
jgi:hypothetical protein